MTFCRVNPEGFYDLLSHEDSLFFLANYYCIPFEIFSLGKRVGILFYVFFSRGGRGGGFKPFTVSVYSIHAVR